jgi:UDP-N-acetyl-D-mannosaminuronate dehydrogenase
MLLENAESLNIKLRIPTLARQINEDMIKHAVNLTHIAFRSGGKNLRRGRVTIFGSANSPSSACMFAQLIEQKGAKATIYDPTAKKDTKGIVKTSLNEAVEGTDCIVILSEIGQFDNAHLKKIKSLMRPPAIVVDLMGNLHALNSDTEGFIYTSLGKGIEKK